MTNFLWVAARVSVSRALFQNHKKRELNVIARKLGVDSSCSYDELIDKILKPAISRKKEIPEVLSIDAFASKIQEQDEQRRIEEESEEERKEEEWEEFVKEEERELKKKLREIDRKYKCIKEQEEARAGFG